MEAATSTPKAEQNTSETEVVDRALKLLQISVRPERYKSVSELAESPEMADALTAARKMLLAERSRNVPQVHAYQFFSENEGALSFTEIADRFKENGWEGLNSYGSVKKCIEGLVVAAKSETSKHIEKLNRLSIVRIKYPQGSHQLLLQVHNYVLKRFRRMGLTDLFDNPENAARAIAQRFADLMAGALPEEWDKRAVSMAGLESFIPYVCDGSTYEQFVSQTTCVWMDQDRLACAILFCENLRTENPRRRQIVLRDIEAMGRMLLNREDLAPGTKEALLECQSELEKKEPNPTLIKKLADNLGQRLRSMWDGSILLSLARSKEIGELSSQVGEEDNVREEHRQFPLETIRNLATLLKQTEQITRSPLWNVDSVGLRRLFEDLEACLTETLKVEAFGGSEGKHQSLLSKKLAEVKEGVSKGLQLRPKASQEGLAEFLRCLRPYNGDRRCRPFELFLFAAQNRLFEDKLVRDPSALSSGFIANRPYDRTLSILEFHGGSPIG